MPCTVLSAEFAHETNTFSQVHAARRHREPPDGIVLGLHSAMATTRHDDGEGELLRRRAQP